MKIIPIIPIFIILPITIIFLILKRKNYLELLIIILLFIINLRPVIITSNKSKSNLLFVIDTSIDMNKTDKDKTRLDHMKNDANYIISNFKNSEIAVITFNNNAKILVPFTYDTDYTRSSINNLKTIKEIFSLSTSLQTPYELIKKEINKDTILIFMSCSKNNEIINYNNLNNKFDNGIVIDYSHNSKQLKKISNDLNIKHINSNNKQELKSCINKLHNQEIKKTDYIETYYLLSLLLLLLIIFDYKDYRSKTI